MSKRIEQSRRRGHYDPRYTALVRPALSVVPDREEPILSEKPAEPLRDGGHAGAERTVASKR
jgi:hypothetical protein